MSGFPQDSMAGLIAKGVPGPLTPGKSFPPRSQFSMGFYLDFPEFTSALHAAGNIDRVSPDVILRFPCPDHSRNHGPMVYA